MSNSKSVYILYEQLMDTDSVVGVYKRLAAAKYAAEQALWEKGNFSDFVWMEKYEGLYHYFHGTEYYIRKYELIP